MTNLNIRLVHDPLDVTAAVAAVARAEAGGVAVFLGTTRAEQHPEQGALVALEYHGYDEMAVKEMGVLAQAACARWPVQAMVLWHRLGVVPVGEASVVIAVSCAHRGEAFDACEFVIDELKKAVPIWKKEIYERAQRWQGEAEAG